MKSMTANDHWLPSIRVGLPNVVVILLLTNLGLLLALFNSSIHNISQGEFRLLSRRDSCIPTALQPSPSIPVSSRRAQTLPPSPRTPFFSRKRRTLYPVFLNTTTLDTSRGELRTFKPHGIASHLIIEFGAYRTGPNKFSVVALISKRLHDLHQPPYSCTWKSGNETIAASNTWPIKPDWELGKIYGTIVVVCTFAEDVGTTGEGGSLVLSVGYDDEYRPPESYTALRERPGEYNGSRWTPPFPYEITFCVSRLYGDVNAQRIREWMAYHALLFGNSSHFLFHDAGGLKEDVYRILKPWIDLGRVTVQNLQLLEVYEGRSHHQFTMLNDCLFRAQTLSNWTFFFDVDEYLYLPPRTSLQEFLAESERKNVSQIRMKTIKMSDALCTLDPTLNDTARDANNARKWAFEKLVYANCDYGWTPGETRKYALQPREAFATGVHYCEYMKRGETMDADEDTLRLYHYHGTIPVKSEVCREFTNGTNGIWIRNCTVDRTMTMLAAEAKQFELDTLGKQPFMV